MLLDEPVAGMTDDETERTGELFNSLKGKHTLVVVEHDMAFVEQLKSKVTVLDEGALLCEGALWMKYRQIRKLLRFIWDVNYDAKG